MAHTIIIGDDSHAKLYAEASRSVQRVAERAERRASPTEKKLITEIREASATLDRLFHGSLLPAVRQGDRKTSAGLHDQILEVVSRTQHKAEQLSDASEQSIAGFNAHARIVQHAAVRWLFVFLMAGIACAFGVAVYLYRAIALPVRRLALGTARISAGDLETKLPVDARDELGDLADRFNAMTAAVKDQQAKLVQSEKLAGIGRLAAGVAHEINNPLGVILGYVKLLRRNADPADEKDLAIVEEEAERCREVVEDLLDLTRTRPLETDDVDLRRLADDVVARVRVSLGDAAPRMEVQGEAIVAGSARKLRQVVHNLVKNAVEVVPPDGLVSVLIETTPPGHVAVTVRDTGSGIKPEHQRYVFEPFFTTKPQGTGLGLAVSRAIARAHGGDLELAAGEGPGAAFRLTLPHHLERAA